MKKILHKWHWFWFKINFKWLMKEYEKDVYKLMYNAIDEFLQQVNSVAIINTTTEEMLNDLIEKMRAPGLN